MKLKNILVGLGILLGAAGTAWAAGAIGSIVSADGTINGCYQQQNGQLRVVAAGEACRDSELPISWAQQGPRGPAGPEGPRGAPGASASTLAIDSLTCTKQVSRGDWTYASFPGTIHAVDRDHLLLTCIPKRHRLIFSAPERGWVRFHFDVEGVPGPSCGHCDVEALEGTATITQQQMDASGAIVTLPPRPWRGACLGQVGETCTLEIDGDKVVTVE